MSPAPSFPAATVSLVAVGLSLGLTWPAHAQWEEELAEQIRDEQGCQVAFVNQVARREVEGRITTLAKVHCEDRRTFEAWRGDEHEFFEFREYEAENVETC